MKLTFTWPLFFCVAGNVSVLAFVLLGKAYAFDTLLAYWFEAFSFGILCYTVVLLSPLWTPLSKFGKSYTRMNPILARCLSFIGPLIFFLFMTPFFVAFGFGHLCIIYALQNALLHLSGVETVFFSPDRVVQDIRVKFLAVDGLLIPALSLLISNLVFVVNRYIIQKDLSASIILKPLINVFTAQFLIVFGGFIVMLTKSFMLALVIFVMLKTAFDVWRLSRQTINPSRGTA